MEKEKIAQLLSNNDISEDSMPDMREIFVASDFRLLTRVPTEVEPELELSQLRIHQESAAQENIECWGFDAAIHALSSSSERKTQFVAFKGAGYSAKLYLDAESSSPIALIVTHRHHRAPQIDASGKVVPDKSQ